MTMCKLSLPFKAFLQSFSLASYVILISQFLQNAPKLSNLNPVLASTLFLLLFVTSALICALSILGYPFWLFLQNRGKEALMLIIYSALWLLLFFVVLLLFLILNNSFTSLPRITPTV